MATFVIMTTYDSPIAIVYPSPHSVVQGQRKKVKAIVDDLNSKARRNHYYAVMIKSGITYA